MAQDGTRQRPVMIHRAPFGSLERLIGILIEEYAGNFPLWLAPVQIRLLPIREEHLVYAEEVAAKLRSLSARVEVDNSGNNINKMIRTAEKSKIPVVGVIGDKEQETNSLSLRVRSTGKTTQDVGSVALAEIIDKLGVALRDRTDFDLHI